MTEILHHKPVMDNNGNWTLAPYALSRDDKGWHDRPVKDEDTKRDRPHPLEDSLIGKDEVR